MQRVFLCIIREGSMKHILLSLIISILPISAFAASYKKATEGKEVVLDKLYPKKGKIRLTHLSEGSLISLIFSLS